MHVAAAICFGLALLCYFVASRSEVAVGLAVLGVCFELVAWVIVLSEDR